MLFTRTAQFIAHLHHTSDYQGFTPRPGIKTPTPTEKNPEHNKLHFLPRHRLRPHLVLLPRSTRAKTLIIMASHTEADLAGDSKSSPPVYTNTDPVDTVVPDRPAGWLYRERRIGPVSIPWYASPKIQLLMVSFVCFLCPGMFNALGGLGGGGKQDATLADNMVRNFPSPLISVSNHIFGG